MRCLGGSFSLVVRLERWVALAWVGGLALFALIFGLTARSAAGAQVGASTVEQQVARMGGHQGGLAAGLAAGLAGWIGLAGWHGGIGFGVMMQAGLNFAVPALFILGAGTLLYGLVPRLAAPILYTLILWSFLIEIIGSTIISNHWLLDTAILTHLGPVPATSLHWTAIAWLTGLALIAALSGLAAFNRRDLAAG